MHSCKLNTESTDCAVSLYYQTITWKQDTLDFLGEPCSSLSRINGTRFRELYSRWLCNHPYVCSREMLEKLYRDHRKKSYRITPPYLPEAVTLPLSTYVSSFTTSLFTGMMVVMTFACTIKCFACVDLGQRGI